MCKWLCIIWCFYDNVCDCVCVWYWESQYDPRNRYEIYRKIQGKKRTGQDATGEERTQTR